MDVENEPMQTYAVSVLKEFTELHNWLGSIAYDKGRYYLCQARRCYTFGEKEPAKPFCVLDQGVISGMNDIAILPTDG